MVMLLLFAQNTKIKGTIQIQFYMLALPAEAVGNGSRQVTDAAQDTHTICERVG